MDYDSLGFKILKNEFELFSNLSMLLFKNYAYKCFQNQIYKFYSRQYAQGSCASEESDLLPALKGEGSR
jgi:hypothetical protein